MKNCGSKPLETTRLLLHPTEEEDLKRIWNILRKEEVSRFYLTSKINDDWEEEKKWQYKKLERANDPDTYIWTIEEKNTHEVMGQMSVQMGPFPEQPEIRDIGWFLDIPYQRQGYAYEAALAILQYMFLEVEIDSIETCAAIENKDSWMLMEKLGFERKDTTHFVDYTFREKPEEVYEYVLTKTGFLKEYFHLEDLKITKDVDKDPYMKHITDDAVLNLTGLSGSGKSTLVEKYLGDPDTILIDTDLVFSDQKVDEDSQHLREYIWEKYHTYPDLCQDFDQFYQDLMECFKDIHQLIIIDSAQFLNMKDLSLLKGEVMILRTCTDTCLERCIKRYEGKHPKASLEELGAYQERKTKQMNLVHNLNDWMIRLDKRNRGE